MLYTLCIKKLWQAVISTSTCKFWNWKG